MVETISNNLVWKFNKELEFPKSIYRDAIRVVLRDKDSAYLFDADKTLPKINNSIQFTKNIYSLDPITIEDSLLFYFDFNTYDISTATADHKYFLLLIPYTITEDGNMHNKLESHVLRELFAEFGKRLTNDIRDKWDEYWTTLEGRRTFYIDSLLVDKQKEKEKNTSFSTKICNLFKGKNTSEVDIHSDVQKYDLSLLNMFIGNHELNLYDVSKPLMNEYVYDKIKSNEDKEALENTVLVISIQRL